MMGWSPRYYIHVPGSVEIGPVVLKILTVFNIYRHGGNLGHVASIMSLNFNFLVPKSFLTKFGSKWPNSF